MFGTGSLQNRSFVQLALVDEGRKSVILDIAGYPPGERVKNQIGAREDLPKQYGDAPEYTLVVAGVTRTSNPFKKTKPGDPET